MGKRGPAKTPTKMRVLRGERRPSQINYLEPKPEVMDAFDAPEDISQTARSVWRETVAALKPTGVLTIADIETLRHYCEAVARYRQASDSLNKSGLLVRGRKGDAVKNPLNQIVRDNADLVRAYARELGLTPSSRASLRGGDAPSSAGSKLEDLFAARRKAQG
jgi:P27 family predicted phage terminase small subunit